MPSKENQEVSVEEFLLISEVIWMKSKWLWWKKHINWLR